MVTVRRTSVGHHDSRSAVQRWRCRRDGLHGNQ